MQNMQDREQRLLQLRVDLLKQQAHSSRNYHWRRRGYNSYLRYLLTPQQG